jgi:hypothetical protein
VDDLAAAIEMQRDGCRLARSPLYAVLLDVTMRELDRGGPITTIFAEPIEDPVGQATALRFLGGVHRLVLQGRAPGLAAFFPSVGGRFEEARDDPEAAFLAAVEEHRDELVEAMGRGVQTNEVGRCAALLVAFLHIARRFELPLRILEIGASAGLNLRWDHFRYEDGADGSAFGDPGSPLRFVDMYRDPLADLRGDAVVVERRGCDRSPIDATTEDGRLTLESFVWPDQVERFGRMDRAIEVARQVPATVDRADAAEWVAARLDEKAEGVATVVYQSIVWPYLSEETRDGLRGAIYAAGAVATASAPVAWVRFEGASDPTLGAEVTALTWPGGEERVLTRGGYHGRPIRLVR